MRDSIKGKGLPQLLTPAEIAEYFSVPKQTVYGWIHRGRMRKIKLGRDIRVRADDILAGVENGNVLLNAIK